MRWMSKVSGLAVAVATLGYHGQGSAQVVPNTSPANVNVLNLLSPFLNLNATTIGQTTLQQNLDRASATNNGSSAVQRAEAISDKALPGNSPNFGTITLANGTVVGLGPADNLAGGLPLQAVQSNPGQPGTIAPNQPVGGYGAVLGPAYQAGVRSSTATSGPLTNTFKLLNSSYVFTSADLGVAKNYFANGAANNPSTTPPGYVPVAAVAPAGYTLPTANGLPNTTNSVLDLAYGVTNKQAGQDVYGDSRPVQVAPNRINAFDPTALNGLATNPSFPSGHTNYAFTDGILLGMLTPTLYQSMLARAADYGNSRIVLGVHYPLDIIASRAFAAYDLAQAFTNPLYVSNAATTSGTAINLPALFTRAQTELAGYLSAQCGATVATCASSAANTADDPYTPSAATQATYQQRLTYGLPTLDFTQAPREAAPAGGPDASILLAPIYGGSTTAATTIAPNGGLDGKLQTSTINQIIVNTESNALAAFSGSALSYWTRIDLYTAAGYFNDVTGTLTMAAADQLTTPVTIGSTGTLFGNGATITGNVTAQTGGTLGGGSGTAVATTTINGNLTLQAGSTYAVTAVNGQASSTNVSGTATIGGSKLAIISAGTFLPFTQVQALNANGGLTGQFASIGASANTNAFVGYGDRALTITLDRTDVNLGAGASTANQSRIGAALTTAAQTTTNTAGGAVANGVFINAQGSGAAARASLDSLGGEGMTGTQNASLAAGHAFVGSIADEQQAFRSGLTGGVAPSPLGVTASALPGRPLGYAPATGLSFPALKGPGMMAAQPSLWRAWGAGFGGESEIDGRPGPGSARQNATFAGGLIGLQYQPQANLIIGAAVGGTTADFNVPNRATSGNVSGANSALYSTYAFASGLYLDSSVAFSGYSNDVRRTAGGVGVLGGEAERGSFNSFEVRVRGEIGERLQYGAIGVTPFTAVEYANLSADGFAEHLPGGGAGALSLNVNARTTESLPVFAGLRLDSVTPLGNAMVLRSFVQAAYVHDFDTVRGLVNNLVSLPGASFLVQGARPASDGAEIKAGAELAVRPNVALFANFDGGFSDVQNVYAGRGGIRVSF